MCGIVGHAGSEISEPRLREAIATLRHRGPDGVGVYLDADFNIGLGHARLSIIDLQTGAQPLFSEDRNIALVCNGEIYGFDHLRAELEAVGHTFATHSDSEVIIHLYEEHGLAFVQQLRGEFAFLLYDKTRGRLLAVRDRFGIKPLFFARTPAAQGNAYCFASEAKALFVMGLVPEIDVTAVRDCLCGVTPDSIFSGVHAVPPGCILELDVRALDHTVIQYWDLDLPPAGDVPGDLLRDVPDVRAGVQEAVRLRLRADVPVGVYLSGGIDSAIVAATAAKFCAGTLKVFNIAFPEDDVFNEYQLAKDMAEKIGAEFYSVRCDHPALLDNMEASLWIAELPFFNFHGVGKFMVSALAREHVTVVLTGEGSDEVFLGYALFQPDTGSMSDPLGSRRRKLKPPRGKHVDEITEVLGFVPMRELAYTFSPMHQRLVRRLFHPRNRGHLAVTHPIDRMREKAPRAKTDGLPLVRRMQYLWIKAMLAPYLLTMLGDRSEMAHSIEGRTPFLDHVLFERAREIPDAFKIHNGVEKHVLREAFKNDVTSAIYQRKKWPYTAPPLWISRRNTAKAEQLWDTYLSGEAVAEAGIFNPRALRLIRFLDRVIFFDCRAKRGLNAVSVFILTVQILAQQFQPRKRGVVQVK